MDLIGGLVLAVFIGTYLVISSEKVNRTATALLIIAVFSLASPLGAEAADIYFDNFHNAGDDGSLIDALEDFKTAVEGAGHVIVQFDAEITLAALGDYDVLMIYDPEDTLTPDEISAIQLWLRSPCHGLWVLGGRPDHFNVVTANTLLAD